MRRLAFGLMLLMVFTLPWENLLDVPGVGRVSKLVGLLVAAAWVAAVVVSGRVREPRPTHYLALLFVLWNACSLMWTVDGPATQDRVLTYVQLLGLMLVVWDTVTTGSSVRLALAGFLAGCYVAATALVVGYAVSGDALEVNGRVTVGTFHPNDVGLILALGVPMVGYLLVAAGTNRHRVLRLVLLSGYVPLAGFGVLVTGSRAALAAMVPGLVYLGYLLGRRRPALATVAVAGLVALTVPALTLVPDRALSRLSGVESAVASGDLNERSAVWDEALRLFGDHPLVGTGGGAFKTAAVGVNKVGHNFVLALLAEVGLIGFGLFTAMLISALLALRRIAPPQRGLWLALFASWLCAALLHNWEYRKQTWLLVGLLVACGSLGFEEEQEDDHPVDVALGERP